MFDVHNNVELKDDAKTRYWKIVRTGKKFKTYEGKIKKKIINYTSFVTRLKTSINMNSVLCSFCAYNNRHELVETPVNSRLWRWSRRIKTLFTWYIMFIKMIFEKNKRKQIVKPVHNTIEYKHGLQMCVCVYSSRFTHIVIGVSDNIMDNNFRACHSVFSLGTRVPALSKNDVYTKRCRQSFPLRVVRWRRSRTRHPATANNFSRPENAVNYIVYASNEYRGTIKSLYI